MSRSPSDINIKNIHHVTVTSDNPMVHFSDWQEESRRSSYVVDVVDFIFLLLSLN